MTLDQPKRSAAALTIAALIALAAPIAYADCPDGVRPHTPSETEFIQRAHAALVAGLPEAVRPLERRSPNRPDPVARGEGSMCRGTPIGAFGAATGDGFMYRFTPDEANARSQQRRELLQQIEALEQLPPDKEAQRKQIEAQMRAAYAAAPTRSRKDPPFTPEQQAQVDRAQAEGRKLEDAMRRIEFDHRASVKPQTDPLRARADGLQQGPQIFSVGIGMNARTFGDPLLPERGQRITFGAPSPKQSASLLPVNIVVTVEGPAGPARDALASMIDRDYLAGLIGKPLPDVVTSQKRIDSNIAQAASAPPLAIASSVSPGAAPAAVAPAAATAASAASPGPSAAPAVAAASSSAAAATASAPPPAQRSANAAPCPPPNRTASSSDAQRSGSQVGAEVGGAVLGGGWGRSIGSSVGGVLGALGGGTKKEEPTPANAATDCPR